MAENELKQIISQLDSLKANNPQQAPQLLSRAKLALLHLNALVPSDKTQQQHLALAAAVLELGALISIKLKDTDAFTRYFQQLQPFYALPAERWGSRSSGRQNNQSKVTGLYLLLLLSVGDYAGFHTVLEGLEMSSGKAQIDKDEFIQHPVRLEQALMEGSYDKVWSETKGERVPSEEYAVFSEVRQRRNYGSRRQDRTSFCTSVLTMFAGVGQHNPLGNRLLLRASIPISTHIEREEPSLPRLRRRGRAVRTVARMGSKGWKNILSAARRRNACRGEGCDEQ